jgi:hypothetical protein
MVGDIGINVVPRITVAGYVEADLVSAFLTEDHLGSLLLIASRDYGKIRNLRSNGTGQ